VLSEKEPLKVLYVVSINATTSVPLEVAGKIAELSAHYNISFYAAAYYQQRNFQLKTDFVKDLVELNFSGSYYFQNIKSYYNLIRKINPHIIHLHHGISAFQGAVLAKLAGVKFVFKTEHNNHKFYKWYQKILTLPVFLLTNRIICNSKSTQLSYYPWEKWIANNKSTFIYNGINITDIAKAASTENRKILRKQYNVSSMDKLFISVGRLVGQKNYIRLVEAMINVSRKNKNIKLIIVGGGHQETQLKKIVEKNQMEQNIFFAGMVRREQVYHFVNAGDFFIVPSLWEGFCNSLVEAMAAGKPILSSDIETLHEVAGDASIAFFNPDSINSIEEAIAKAASLKDDEKKFFAEAAKKRACDNFTLERTAERYIHEYRKAMATCG
jgi:glycosyltransferase involved in cell wall biosynthesis